MQPVYNPQLGNQSALAALAGGPPVVRNLGIGNQLRGNRGIPRYLQMLMSQGINQGQLNNMMQGHVPGHMGGAFSGLPPGVLKQLAQAMATHAPNVGNYTLPGMGQGGHRVMPGMGMDSLVDRTPLNKRVNMIKQGLGPHPGFYGMRDIGDAHGNPVLEAIFKRHHGWRPGMGNNGAPPMGNPHWANQYPQPGRRRRIPPPPINHGPGGNPPPAPPPWMQGLM